MSTTYTENYQLGMQENHNDKFSMAVITENAKIIDGLLKAHEKHIVGFIDGDSRKNLLPVNSTEFYCHKFDKVVRNSAPAAHSKRKICAFLRQHFIY